MSSRVKVFSSSQISSPVLNGLAGTLDAVLYACLVTGFNTKTISSLVVTNQVGLVTTSADHGYSASDIISISGANESIFNAEFEIRTIVSATSFTIKVPVANTSATGTISCKIAPLGWTRVFTGTNKSVYRPSVGNKFYLRVDDSNLQYTIATIYETMTGVDAGTNSAGPVYWKKSNISTNAVREWYLIGNDRTFYLFIPWNSSSSTHCSGYGFGDFNSIKAVDLYSTFLIGHNTTAPSYPEYNINFNYITYSTNYATGQFLIRSYTDVVGSCLFFKISQPSGQMGYATGINYPNLADLGIHLYPVDIIESSALTLRGQLPGLYVPLESTNGAFASNNRTIKINNRVFLAIKLAVYSVSTGNCFIDITGPW